MKTKILVVLITLLITISVQGQKQHFKIEDCSVPLEIVEGTKFIFPDSLTLKTNNLVVVKEKSGYVLKERKSNNKRTSTNQIIIGSGNTFENGTTIIQDGNTTVINSDQNGNTITVINGVTTINGKVVDQSNKKTTNPTTKIFVPKGTNMYIAAKNSININVPIDTLQLTCSGTSDIKIAKVNNISVINVSGTGDVTIQSCNSINIINISGAGNVIIQACTFINMLNISGVGDITIPKTTKVELETINGMGEVKKL